MLNHCVITVLLLLAVETGKADVYLNERDLNEGNRYFNYVFFILCHIFLLSPLE